MGIAFNNEPTSPTHPADKDFILGSYELQDNQVLKLFESLVESEEASTKLWEHYNNHNIVKAYLMAKYDAFEGLPVEYLSEELMPQSHEEMIAIKSAIKDELGLRQKQQLPAFIPFEIITDVLIGLEEIRKC